MSIFATATLPIANGFSTPGADHQNHNAERESRAAQTQQMLFGWMENANETAPATPVGNTPIRKQAGQRIPLGVAAPPQQTTDSQNSKNDACEIKALAFQINNLKKQHAARLARRRQRANQLQHISQPMQTVLESYGISKEEIASFENSSS